MYPEFIAIYIMLIIIIALLGGVLFFLMKLLQAGDTQNTVSNYYNQQPNEQYYGQSYQNSYQAQANSVVFCNHCATQFDSSQSCCPNCGARR